MLDLVETYDRNPLIKKISLELRYLCPQLGASKIWRRWFSSSADSEISANCHSTATNSKAYRPSAPSKNSLFLTSPTTPSKYPSHHPDRYLPPRPIVLTAPIAAPNNRFNSSRERSAQRTPPQTWVHKQINNQQKDNLKTKFCRRESSNGFEIAVVDVKDSINVLKTQLNDIEIVEQRKDWNWILVLITKKRIRNENTLQRYIGRDVLLLPGTPRQPLLQWCLRILQK